MCVFYIVYRRPASASRSLVAGRVAVLPDRRHASARFVARLVVAEESAKGAQDALGSC